MNVRNDQAQRSRHGLSCVSEKPSISENAVLTGRKTAELAALFETLANDTRLRVLNVLAHSVETSPMELAQKVSMKPQAICNQLRRLFDRGIIERRREGKQVYYRIVDPCVIDLLERGLWLIKDAELRKETSKGRRTWQRELVETPSSDGSQFRDPSAPRYGSLGAFRRNPESQINNKESTQ
jgi:ArsR family transcriptional regulator, lead/cadmium/zinc/bismuth-responsive transcriptional repressor